MPEPKKFRFAAVISHPIQHYSPLFRELARLPGIDVRVIYLCDHGVRSSFDPGFGQSFQWDVPLLEGYEHEFLRPGFSPRTFGFREVDSPLVKQALDRFSPHAIWIHGYGQRISWRAADWARRRAALIYFGDSELLRARTPKAKLLKRVVLPRFFARCDAFLTVGDNNEAYYRHYGVPDEKMFRGPCPVDMKRFISAGEQSSPENKREVRAGLRLAPGAFVVAQSGKIEPQKRPLDLVDAIGLLRMEGANVSALFIGDGPLRAELEQRAVARGVQEHVRVSGFVNQSKIPEILSAADALAMTSERDAHPLAVTESLAFGHPIIASDRVGCVGSTDTARPDVNAFVYPCGDIGALARAIKRLYEDPVLYDSMSAESRRLAPEQDVSVTVDAVLQALLALREKFRAIWTDVDPTAYAGWVERVLPKG
jgi:glycosyltransferase involved in cell wall biosynthesis